MNPWHPLPSAVYAFVEQTPGSLLLESSRPSASAVSRLFTAPHRVLEIREFSELPALFSQIENATARGHFAAGYFAYECGQYFEPTAALRRRRDNDLLAWFGIYARCHTFNHISGDFQETPPGLPDPFLPGTFERPALAADLDEPQYAERIAQIHDWIRAGDVYQLNFTFPLTAHITEPAAVLYARLRAAQPVDYGAFLHCQAARPILSLSPELFFRIEQQDNSRRITTKPMKGTARRGRTTAEDREIAQWLRGDAKNRAENVMIVDLIRNDLGRLCTFGSVQVEKLFDVERFPTLWQMTSTVTGELRPEVGFEQIFRALFPCGSITGAPKVRTMQLLAQIENEPRGIYTGAIGFFSREQSIFNVAIRTLSIEDEIATMGVGGGIVIDSNPAAEYRECRLKAEFITDSAEPFSLIETMLWNDGIPLLDLHLDRLEDSAAYFGFPCNRGVIETSLLAGVSKFSKHSSKVRLLLDPDGTLHFESEILTDPDSNPARVCLATQRTDPSDRFLFHKTTRRALYNSVLAAATDAGFADALFFNSRNELTEGAISNVFIEKAGRCFTPPLDCGVLPGVYRRHLFQTRSDIEERILTLDDLKSADSIYISNAVRGLRGVSVSFDFILS